MVTLRLALVTEEYLEMVAAIKAGDLVGIAKEGCDMIFVTLGTLIAYGVDAVPCWAAVVRSNLSKSTEKNAAGKTVKGNGYNAPDIEGILANQRGIAIPTRACGSAAAGVPEGAGGETAAGDGDAEGQGQ
jgi:hypothetical protein